MYKILIDIVTISLNLNYLTIMVKRNCEKYFDSNLRQVVISLFKILRKSGYISVNLFL